MDEKAPHRLGDHAARASRGGAPSARVFAPTGNKPRRLHLESAAFERHRGERSRTAGDAASGREVARGSALGACRVRFTPGEVSAGLVGARLSPVGRVSAGRPGDERQPGSALEGAHKSTTTTAAAAPDFNFNFNLDFTPYLTIR